MRNHLLIPANLFLALISIAAVVFFPTSANAKCPSYYYIFVGKVVDVAGKPIDGARVYPFVDGSEIAYTIISNPSGELLTDHRITNKAGEYEVPVKLNSYSGPGFFEEESCSYIATSATLIIVKDGYYAKRVSKKFRLKFKNGFDKPISMQTVSLRPIDVPLP